MFIEIKKVEYLLNDEFEKTKAKENKYAKDKLIHSYDCLYILKKMYPIKFRKYAAPVLLHDIGRFYEYKNIKKFDHAQYGYQLLKSKNIKEPKILLPIKYHEDDLNWLEKINLDKEYLDCNKHKQKKIIKCCSLVRDIDIISNMKIIANKNYKKNNIKKINNNLINKLKIGTIGSKEDINNEYDEIIYILCGLNIISFNKSFKYIKKEKITEKLIQILFNIIDNNNQKLYNYTVEIKNIINDNFGL